MMLKNSVKLVVSYYTGLIPNHFIAVYYRNHVTGMGIVGDF